MFFAKQFPSLENNRARPDATKYYYYYCSYYILMTSYDSICIFVIQYVSIISITQRSHKSVPWLWHEAGFALISCQISRIACACNSCRKTLGFPMNFIAATAPLKEGHASNVKSVHAEKNPRNLGLCSLRCFFPIALITPSDSYQLPLNPFEFGISRYPHNYQSPFPIRSVFFFWMISGHT